MTVKVVSASDNVNDLLKLMRGHILKSHRIAPSSYIRLTYNYLAGGIDGGASENHDTSAAGADFASFVYGWPTTFPVEVMLAWLEKLLATKIYLQKEGALLSPIYFEHHTQEPMIVVLWACETMAARGDERFARIAPKLREWLRVGIGYAALLAQPVKPKSWSEADKAAMPKGPGVQHARSAPREHWPQLTVAACGRRGWDLLGDGSWLNSTFHNAVWPLAEFGLGLTVSLPSWAAATLWQAHRWKPNLFTPDEQATIARAIHQRDVGAIAWIEREVIRDWMPISPVAVLMTTGGKSSTILQATGGATSALVTKTDMATGDVYAMGVDSPHRGGKGPSYNRAHTARIDLERRVVVAQAKRNDVPGYDNPVVECPLPPGDIYYYKVFSQAGIVNMLSGSAPGEIGGEDGVATPPPAAPEPPAAPGKADAFDWLVNAHANVAAVGPGWFSVVSPIVGHPDLFVIRKSDGPRPFSTELLWRDAERERIALIAECGYGPAGELGNLRTFWADDGRPGVTWLPRWISRTKPTTLRVTGQLVENAITADGAPYRPDGTRLAAGEWQQAKVDADVVIEHVGVTGQLGEQAAVLRRTDTMGDRSRPEIRNREVYEIAFGRGAYGYVAWKSFRAGEFDRGGAATSIATPSAPCAVAGFDPMDPDCRERWFATPGHPDPLPRPFAATRRPAPARSESEGRSWLEWFMDWLGL